jgi:SAM-dependent methyltransferase
MDLTEYRASDLEQQRTEDLTSLMPTKGRRALDVGARDGHFSRFLADRFEAVTALDLNRPTISHPKIECIEGSAAQMKFADKSFDFVFCAEVLEHVPSEILDKVCAEIERVANDKILIGVPYKQDIRVGRTTCYTCGKTNPPWGHVNSFDEAAIGRLFRSSKVESLSFVGSTNEKTNSLSTVLMDFAGNPYGTYEQDEQCVHCDAKLLLPPKRSPAQLIATKLAFWSRKPSEMMAKPRGNWVHIILRKEAGKS